MKRNYLTKELNICRKSSQFVLYLYIQKYYIQYTFISVKRNNKLYSPFSLRPLLSNFPPLTYNLQEKEKNKQKKNKTPHLNVPLLTYNS